MTDEALDLFAKQVILDALRFERENTGETKTGFSPSKKYQHQMREMSADPQGWCQRKMRPAWKKTLRRVAAVFLAATVGVSAWLAVDTDARAAFFGWVKEIYETYVVFRHDGITDTVPESADYRPTWLPNGYSEFRVNTSETRTVVIYDNEAGEMIRFSFIQNPDETDWFIDVSQAGIKNATVNGNKANLLIAQTPEEANAIAWISDDTAFYVTGFVNENDLVRIAESVQIIK